MSRGFKSSLMFKLNPSQPNYYSPRTWLSLFSVRQFTVSQKIKKLKVSQSFSQEINTTAMTFEMKKPTIFTLSEEVEEQLPHLQMQDESGDEDEEQFTKKDKLKFKFEFNVKKDKSPPSANLSIFAQEFSAHALLSDKSSASWSLGFPVSAYLKVRFPQ